MINEPSIERSNPGEVTEAQQSPRPEIRAVVPPTAEESASCPAHHRSWPTVLLASVAVVVLLGLGALGGTLLDRGDGRGAAQAPVPLPMARGAAPADQGSKAIRSVYASASPSVVQVEGREGRRGTGFVVDADGTIVTNAHVVGGVDQLQVRLGDKAELFDARVLGSDVSSDLAALRLDDATAASNLRPLVLADSDTVKVGDLAVAIGYPLGLDRTITAGIISGVGRAIKAPNGFSIDKVIQTDAPINPGNSGGPLLDAAGRVIGVNSQIATAGGRGGSVGIGFAVASNTVSQVVPRLRAGAAIRRPYLGLSSIASTVRQGAVVASTIGGGPAEQGGMLAGDIIRSVDGKPVHAPEDISSAIQNHRPGDEIDIEVQRTGAPKQALRVKLGTRPEHSP